MSFFENLLVDITKSAVKVVAKKTLSEKAYQTTSIVLTVIATIVSIVVIGYFIFFLSMFSGYKGG